MRPLSPSALPEPKERPSLLVAALLFFGIVPATAHLLFSSLGFNPTDDGFILASSRRLLEGQVPHRDFISIRPAGSALLHLPLLCLGGEHAFWVSRGFVWLEFACIGWAWMAVFSRLLRRSPGAAEAFVEALWVFLLCTHCFPIMPWHTVDGLFLLSLGLMLCVRETDAGRLFGYVLVGAAALCKQNFLAAVPVCLVVLGDGRRARCWLAALAPAAAYLAGLAAAGALPDAALQLTAQTDLRATGIAAFLTRNIAVPWGLIVGYAAGPWLRADVPGGPLTRLPQAPRIAGLCVCFGVPLLASLALSSGRFLDDASFGLFGVTLGATLAALAVDGTITGPVRAALPALMAAWCASVSVGYNRPALAAGIMALWLTASTRESLSARIRGLPVHAWLTALVTAIALVGWLRGRVTAIYRERPAWELTRRLDGVFPGARKIRTDPNTYAFLSDLRVAVAGTGGGAYAIVPDVAGYWAAAPASNPLPIDWPQATELCRPALLRRTLRVLEKERGKITILVQKVESRTLAEGFKPVDDGPFNAIVPYARTRFRKIGETRYFELYR
jgi:hypothetical protein